MTYSIESPCNALLDCIEHYIKGLHDCDWPLLSSVFHEQARYINATSGHYVNHSMDEYKNIIQNRVSPASKKEHVNAQITSLHTDSSDIAFITLEMNMLNRTYSDYLTCIYQHQQWLIISKVFTHQSQTH